MTKLSMKFLAVDSFNVLTQVSAKSSPIMESRMHQSVARAYFSDPMTEEVSTPCYLVICEDDVELFRIRIDMLIKVGKIMDVRMMARIKPTIVPTPIPASPEDAAKIPFPDVQFSGLPLLPIPSTDKS